MSFPWDEDLMKRFDLGVLQREDGWWMALRPEGTNEYHSFGPFETKEQALEAMESFANFINKCVPEAKAMRIQ